MRRPLQRKRERGEVSSVLSSIWETKSEEDSRDENSPRRRKDRHVRDLERVKSEGDGGSGGLKS